MVLKLLFMTLRIWALLYTSSPLYRRTQIIYRLGKRGKGRNILYERKKKTGKKEEKGRERKERKGIAGGNLWGEGG